MNEKHQDKKGKAICKYYIEGRCTWVREDECLILKMCWVLTAQLSAGRLVSGTQISP